MTIKKSPAIIRITNQALQTIIGVNEWERNRKQNIIINIELSFDPAMAILSDDLKDTLDYRGIKRQIVEEVNHSSFCLLEKLTDYLLDILMSYEKVLAAKIKIDKPHALRYADSVSVERSAQRQP